MFKKVALGIGVVLGLAVLAGVFWVLTHPPASPSEQALKLLGGSTAGLRQAMATAQVGGIQTARARFGEFEEIWEQVESAVAGTSPESYRTSVLDYLPAIDWLGIFPTWETAIAQLALLLGGVAVLVLERRPRPGLA